jgi:glycosyltransferase involved in cell wall biosynthesis
MRLLMVVNVDWFLVSHRLPLLLGALREGHEIHVATSLTQSRSQLEAYGFKVHSFQLNRGGVETLGLLNFFVALLKIFSSVKPDVLHLVTIKPVLLGGVAARILRLPAVVSAMSGLGFLFTDNTTVKAALLRLLSRPFFRWALGHPNQVQIFQNPNDRDQMLAISHASKASTRIIRGSGIDLTSCQVLPEPNGIPIVVMASRLLRDKGVFEFVEAARTLSDRGISARFWLIGEPDSENPTSVSPQDVSEWREEGIVECLGYRQDVPSLYSQAHIVALPSYREGLPKSLIEAAACGRAVVTTDVPGCRDAIEPNVTGLLVPPRDALELANALERLIQDPALRQSMGKAGRALAERDFGIEKVVATHLEIYKELLDKCASR